jgi:hypothetical protein
MQGLRITSSRISRSVGFLCGWRVGEYLHWIPKSASAFRHAGLRYCELSHKALLSLALRVADKGVPAEDTQIGQRFPRYRARELSARA